MTDQANELSTTTREVDSTPKGKVKRWLTEWDLATKREKEWRDEAEKVWRIYNSKDQRGNSFNILWSNTETLRPSIYNSLPKADVRRRFRDADPVGKIVSTILARAITFELDQYDFDTELQHLVLDVCLPGRGVARVKYEPKFRDAPEREATDAGTPTGEPEGTPAPGVADANDDDTWLNGPKDQQEPEEHETPDEELAGESAITEHVQWDDYRQGPGKTWKMVPWVGFRHEMPYDQLEEMFGKPVADKVKLQDVENQKDIADKQMRSLVKVGVVLEIWDKASRTVLFVTESVKEEPLLELPDPLGLRGFFPMPRPVYAIEDSTTLVPAILYKKYEPQAVELNRVTFRINKIVDALKVRGAYSAHLSEVATIIESEDNVMTPIANASEIAGLGGLDKAIWMMPIDKLIQVLQGLYIAREKTIDTIYQVTGLGDVMRGVSNPHETLGAQKIKSQWGSLRLQRIQREVQRFVRDIVRLKAEILAGHFQPETLQQMTGIQLPTAQQKAQLQAQMQAASQPPVMPGQMPAPQPPAPPPPSPEQQAQAKKVLALPTWDDVMQLMRSDAMRQYRIDVETDSTISETIDKDVEGLTQAITGITQMFGTFGPAIEKGILKVDVVKELALEVARNMRMGNAVEDAIEQIEQPPPPQPPPPPPDFSVQVANIRGEAQKAAVEAKTASDQQIAQLTEQTRERVVKMQTDAHAAALQTQHDTKVQIAGIVENAKRDIAAAQDQAKADREAAAQQAQFQMQEMKSALDAAVKLIVAQIMATKAADAATEANAESEINSEIS